MRESPEDRVHSSAQLLDLFVGTLDVPGMGPPSTAAKRFSALFAMTRCRPRHRLGNSTLMLHFKNTHFGNLAFVTRHRKVISIQLRHQNGRLSLESARDMSDLLVVVSVFLLKYIDEVTARKVNSLTLRIISHVVALGPTGKAGNYRAGIRVQND